MLSYNKNHLSLTICLPSHLSFIKLITGQHITWVSSVETNKQFITNTNHWQFQSHWLHYPSLTVCLPP